MKTSKQGLATVSIKGKDYVMVNPRVQYFRKNFKDYTLQTTWLRIDEKMAICKAIVKTPDGKTYSTGTAMETSADSFINKTSHIENCETSAIGRALGFCDIGIDVSIASAEEVENAINSQSKKGESSKSQAPPQGTPPRNTSVFKIKEKTCTRKEYIDKICETAKKKGLDIGDVISHAKIDKDFPDMKDEEVLKTGKALLKEIEDSKK